jgi:preprotein translocase subunit SecF
MTGETPVVSIRRGLFARLYHGETAFDFVHRRRVWFALSAAVILIGLGSLWLRGLNLGIDFEGGTSWEVPAPAVSVAEARDALRPLGLADAKVQLLGGDTIRVQHETSDVEAVEEVTGVLATLAETDARDVSVETVGPTWGQEISNKAQRALVFFFLAITVYITLRFEWKMAIATLAALFHDLLVTVGVYSLAGFEVTPATVIAILTILGYSIYDGIVVFDKVDENTRGLAASGRMTYGDMVNVSLNQVLMRTLNTSITALLPNVALLVIGARLLGATTLSEFALALLVGLAASSYSSLFVASPILAVLKEREPRYRSIRQRLEGRGGGTGLLTPAGAPGAAGAPGGAGDSTGRPASTGDRPVAPPSSAPARPRKRDRRRR